jgi:hypothetical protein
MAEVNLKDIVKFLFNTEMVRCNERFKLTASNISCSGNQLFATADIVAVGAKDASGKETESGKEVITSATLAVFDAGADVATGRFCRSVLGPANATNETTTFKLPLALSVSLFPFEMKETKGLWLIVGLTTPGTNKMCFLDQVISVKPQR